jgi:hypothetical protein
LTKGVREIFLAPFVFECGRGGECGEMKRLGDWETILIVKSYFPHSPPLPHPHTLITTAIMIY